MVGQIVGKNYRIVRLLGRGGMGAVYEAERLDDGARVAVKVIEGARVHDDPGRFGRFQREARAVGAIDSEHIARLIEAGTDEASDAPFMVMELLEGEDLHQLIKRVGALTPDAAARVVAQACIGVAKAHASHVVHRDIKPANIFLARQAGGEIIVKILDFGIAKIRPDDTVDGETTGLTRTGSMIGSPLYMSPEQARGVRDISYRSDIWSLGVVLYRALSGRTPHEGTEALGDLIIALCSTQPPPVQEAAPWVSPAIAAVVDGALQIDPEDRFPTADAMLEALRAVLPDGFALREEMLSGPDPGARARVAPRLERTAGGSSTSGSRRRGTPRPSTRPGPLAETQAREPTTRADVARTQAPPSLGTRWTRPAIAGASLALGALVVLAAFGAAAGLRRGPVPAVAPVAPVPAVGGSASAGVGASAAPTIDAAPPAPTSRRVAVVVLPSDAAVEVDGAPATVHDGTVDLDGTPGSKHRVRVVKGGREVVTEVAVTETGAVPAKVELVARPGGRPGPLAPPAGSAAPSPPKAKPLLPDRFE